ALNEAERFYQCLLKLLPRFAATAHGIGLNTDVQNSGQLHEKAFPQNHSHPMAERQAQRVGCWRAQYSLGSLGQCHVCGHVRQLVSRSESRILQESSGSEWRTANLRKGAQ